MNKYGKTTLITLCENNIAFVDFESPDDAAKAKEALHRQPGLGTDSLIVDFKRDQVSSLDRDY